MHILASVGPRMDHLILYWSTTDPKGLLQEMGGEMGLGRLDDWLTS